MWWPLVGEETGFETPRFSYEPVVEDIESLNQASESGDLEITALSCAQCPFVAGRYAIATCGSSMGDQYGPRIVSNRRMTAQELARGECHLAVPGERTTALAAARILLGPDAFRWTVVPFDQVIPQVAAGRFDAGLVIHEGQLTFSEAGLHLVEDLGMWWSTRSGLPLPLGVNAVRRDLDQRHGAEALGQVVADLRAALQYSLDHRGEALAHAMGYARDTPREVAERFVEMYVNRWTLDLGSVGRAAIRAFLEEAHRAGLSPEPRDLCFVEPL